MMVQNYPHVCTPAKCLFSILTSSLGCPVCLRASSTLANMVKHYQIIICVSTNNLRMLQSEITKEKVCQKENARSGKLFSFYLSRKSYIYRY